VERDVLAGLGEQQLPPALLPAGHVLS